MRRSARACTASLPSRPPMPRSWAYSWTSCSGARPSIRAVDAGPGARGARGGNRQGHVAQAHDVFIEARRRLGAGRTESGGQDGELERLNGRIQALRAKTVDQGCTEAEALAPAVKVAELLDRYGLSLSELDLKRQTCEGAPSRPAVSASARSTNASRRSPRSSIAEPGARKVRTARCRAACVGRDHVLRPRPDAYQEGREAGLGFEYAPDLGNG